MQPSAMAPRMRALACLPLAVLAVVIGLPTPPANAQVSSGRPSSPGAVTASGSIRIRGYLWDWFGDDSGGEYAYPAAIARITLSQSKSIDWRAELAFPIVVSLPTDAVRPPPQGQLGLGASYFAANGNSANNAALFLKQGFVRFKPRSRFGTQSLTIGRLEYNDGAEVAPSNGTLAALKRERISQRLIGSFGFSDVGRSVDGAEYTLSTKTLNVTALAGRPTQGVFDVDGWPELRANLFYGALTKQVGYRRAPAEWRIFGLGYDDYRHIAGKADNRSPIARNGDTSSIVVATIGGHYLQAVETHAGPIDILGWAAIQNGSWGTLMHRAVAFAAEGGWQPRAARAVALWIRGGYDYGSGDADPGDQTHGTFFQVLPTPRVYARLPFFNMMNSSDAFGALILKPASRVMARADVHSIGLSDADDLWYSGGGAFEAGSFGYAGRPSSGHAKLATLTDISVDWTANAHMTLTGYYGWAHGGPVSRAIYSNDGTARFGYVEALVRF